MPVARLPKNYYDGHVHKLNIVVVFVIFRYFVAFRAFSAFKLPYSIILLPIYS